MVGTQKTVRGKSRTVKCLKRESIHLGLITIELNNKNALKQSLQRVFYIYK